MPVRGTLVAVHPASPSLAVRDHAAPIQPEDPCKPGNAGPGVCINPGAPSTRPSQLATAGICRPGVATAWDVILGAMGEATASQAALRVETALRRWPLVALCPSYLAYVASVAVTNGFFPKIVTGAWYQMNDPFSDAAFTVTLILAPLSIAAWGTCNRIRAHQNDKSTPERSPAHTGAGILWALLALIAMPVTMRILNITKLQVILIIYSSRY